MIGMHDDPKFESRLWNVARGGQDGDLMRHISTCDDCEADLGALRQLAHYRATTGGGLTAPPASLVERLAGMLPVVRPDLSDLANLADRSRPAAPAAVTEFLSRVRRITAELLLDSAATPQVAGLRSGGDRRTRQLAFVSEVADLDLEVSQREDGYTVAGQLGMDTVPPNLVIRFVPSDQDPLAEDMGGSFRSPISRGGYFELLLTAGEWVAAVDIDDAVVLFPGVRL